jgi:hypothetical protein
MREAHVKGSGDGKEARSEPCNQTSVRFKFGAMVKAALAPIHPSAQVDRKIFLNSEYAKAACSLLSSIQVKFIVVQQDLFKPLIENFTE